MAGIDAGERGREGHYRKDAISATGLEPSGKWKGGSCGTSRTEADRSLWDRVAVGCLDQFRGPSSAPKGWTPVETLGY